MSNIDNSQDIIDVRDVIARAEELEDELTEVKDETSEQAEAMDLGEWIETLDVENHPFKDSIEEALLLRDLLEELKGTGGDEQWRGDWYPVTLIRDSYFEEYAQELAEEIGAINKGATWPNNCIDWERAAEELQVNYTTVDYDGVQYWFR